MPKHRQPQGIGERHPGSQYDADEIEFLRAIELYRRKRPFPTWTEVLALLRRLGYRKVEPDRSPSPLTGEGPHSPSPLTGEGRGGGDGACG